MVKHGCESLAKNFPTSLLTCVCPGRISEAERDRIEEQVGRYMRSCTANISRLEASLGADQPGARGLNSHMVAHRHGVVRVPSCALLLNLVLLEMLQVLLRLSHAVPAQRG